MLSLFGGTGSELIVGKVGLVVLKSVFECSVCIRELQDFHEFTTEDLNSRKGESKNVRRCIGKRRCRLFIE